VSRAGRAIPLSVLDLVPVASGRDVRESLDRSLDLARRAEAAGYQRLWFAEHHLNPGVIGSAPAVLIALAGGVTERIRLGSGAVQLGHRTALSVAEEFGLLATAFPGRIDLGLGRSGGRPPGPPTSEDALPAARTVDGLLIPPPFTGWAALAGSPRFAAQRSLLSPGGADTPDYDDQVGTILELLGGKHTMPGGVDVAVPAATVPEVFVLGSSGGESAAVAGRRGLPFAANYHVAPSAVLEAVTAYRAQFRPSPELDRPYVVVSADVVVGETDTRADHLASGYAQWVHSIRTGAGAIEYPSPGQAAAWSPMPADLDLVADRLATRFVGAPATVVERLAVLARVTGADEVLITSITHDHEARMLGHELLIDAWARART
jgi:alkanesulfonate monooxygenase SsuD/methylene tetrahydromethanopterin reductase-like flavin-dependent oxidoreductase (luciferase family)